MVKFIFLNGDMYMNPLNASSSSSSFFFQAIHSVTSRMGHLGTALAISLIAGGLIYAAYQTPPKISTERLCVLYDAGETAGLLPVLKKWEREGKDFRVLVMGTAATLIKSDMFLGKRLELQDLGIQEKIDVQTARTQGLSSQSLAKLKEINPKLVLVGTASRIQQQALELFPKSSTVAFVDNFNYDPNFESYATVEKVQAAAKHVLCPSKNLIDLFSKEKSGTPTRLSRFHVVGKPTLESWEKEIGAVDQAQVMNKLSLTPQKKTVTFIGGYGAGYEVMNPLFSECAERLKKEGYQVIVQPHPKVEAQTIKTTEALAVSDYVVGYNTSVILDAALVGKNAFHFISEKTPFQHFAINQGLIGRVSTIEELLQYLREEKKPADVRKALDIPANSTDMISSLIDQWVE